jgi:hypothetical protein
MNIEAQPLGNEYRFDGKESAWASHSSATLDCSLGNCNTFG